MGLPSCYSGFSRALSLLALIGRTGEVGRCSGGQWEGGSGGWGRGDPGSPLLPGRRCTTVVPVRVRPMQPPW